MRHSNKINVLLRKAIRELNMICYRYIPNIGNVKQHCKCYLKGLPPTPHIMPKINLGAVTHLKSSTSRKLLPIPPNEFPETHPIRPINSIRAPHPTDYHI
jgi:hypothetical protein